MTHVFGEVAAMYDDVRPGYPASVLEAIVDFQGAPASVAELGAGTGKGTELLVRLGVPVTCVEPDPRMAAVLATKFPQVEVATVTFEEWTPPAGGVDVVACALAWHWLDPATRNEHSRAALAPGGALAVFGHTYGYADPAVSAAIDGVLRAVDPSVAPRAAHWVRDDVRASGAYGQVEELVWHTYPEFSKQRYLQLIRTFSPFRRRSAEDQRAALAGLEAVLPASLTLDLTTTLVLARG
jgi:trans-aconitate methyltransferase